jgi:ribonuclease E
MKKEMLINVAQPEECRIAILENGVLEELYVERSGHENYVGNIYKGRIVNIEPSIQAAFVDFGVGRNGFLHISDVEPMYYQHLEQRRDRDHGDRNDRNDRNDRPQVRDRDRDRGRGRDRDRDRPPRTAPVEREEGPPPIVEQESVEQPWFEQESFAEERPVEITVPEGFVVDFLDVEVIDVEVIEFETPPDVIAAELPVAEAEPAPPATAEADLTALPGTQLEEEPAKGRRRSRGGPRRRRGAASEPAAEAAPESEPPPSLPMESAERRTTDKDDLFQHLPDGGIDDDLFFFPPRVEPAAPPPPPEAHEPEPEREPEPAAPEPAAWNPPPPRAPSRQGGRPPARPRPSSRGSVEDDLAADLAALDIEGDSPSEPQPARAEFETELPENAPHDLETGPPPRPREPRNDRDRRDDRRGGPRNDDRGGPRRDDRGPRRDDRSPRRDDRGPRRDDRSGPRRDSRPGMTRDKPLIQDVFKRGQEVLVRVIKEGLGTKGPTLSTYLSIPGRYLVIMPHITGIRVSRKIEDDEHRRRMREIFSELKPPRGLGFILRTAAVDKNRKELQRDLAYLSRLWQVMVKRIQKVKAPAEIYQESDMITRTIRDNFTADIDTVWIDDPAAFERAREFCEIVMPRYASRLKLYEGKEPLFHNFGIEQELHKIQQRKVPLPFGGSIVIEQTEAMVAIDVNSGNFRADRQDADETAYQMNLQAAREIARQLRLRDLTGIIVNDFIDMRSESHRRGVERAFGEALMRDRARSKILKTSAFGLIEMTRQRTRQSLKRSVYQDCPHCHGMAQVKTCESMSLEVVRLLQLAACREGVTRIEVRVAPAVADYLLNKKRREIAKLEEGGALVHIQGTPGAPAELLEFQCLDKNNNEVRVLPQEAPPPMRHRR